MSDINQLSLPTPFYSVLKSICLYGPFNCISFHKSSRQFSTFSLCSSGLISTLLTLSTIHLSVKKLPQPWYNPLWLIGLKAPSNLLNFVQHGACSNFQFCVEVWYPYSTMLWNTHTCLCELNSICNWTHTQVVKLGGRGGVTGGQEVLHLNPSSVSNLCPLPSL